MKIALGNSAQLYDPPKFLVLDEQTNQLDLATVFPMTDHRLLVSSPSRLLHQANSRRRLPRFME